MSSGRNGEVIMPTAVVDLQGRDLAGADNFPGDKVHGGQADELRDELRFQAFVEVEQEPTFTMPLSQHDDAVSVIASTWSWVT